MQSFLMLILVLSEALKIPLKKASTYLAIDNQTSESSLNNANYINRNYELQYTANFSIGYPEQYQSLVLNMTIQYFTVPSVNGICKEPYNCYDPSKSSSYINYTTPFEVNNDVCVIEGFPSKDSFSIGNLTSSSQYFILTTMDYGILGLGMKYPSETYFTFIESLKAEHQIESKIFSIYLADSDEIFPSSCLTIGEVNFELYGQSEISSIKVDDDKINWQADVSKVSIGGSVEIENSGALAVFDIGTLVISGLPNVIDEFFKIVRNNRGCSTSPIGEVTCDCSNGNYDNFPSLDFTIQNQTFSISPQSYIYFDNGHCYFSVKKDEFNVWRLGVPFFNEYYSVFDIDQKQIHLSKAFKVDNTLHIWVAFITIAVVAIFVFTASYLVFKRNDNLFRYRLMNETRLF